MVVACVMMIISYQTTYTSQESNLRKRS